MQPHTWFIVNSPDGAAREVGECTIAAFREELGSDRVRTFDTRAFRDGFEKLLKQPTVEMVTDLLNQSLAVSCLDSGATRCLVLALAPVTLFTLNLLRKRGVTTLHWFYEDFRRALYWREVVAGYDHFCAVQYGPLPQACAEAGRTFHFVPTAGVIPSPVSGPERRNCDVAFIGVPSPYRVAVLETLARRGLSLVCAGAGWGGYRGILEESVAATGWVSPAESAEILSKAKIGINLSYDAPGNGREHLQISPRAYDILASGALLVTEETGLLSDSLAGCTWHEFRSIDEAAECAAELISGYQSLGSEIARNRQTVAKQHTYRDRVRSFLGICDG